ncbi:MAG: hypothetical protein IJX44_03035 [Bacteroidaceae bacterium]|nr:hypothetical protein [Bacteroidaceae bacterium]
MKKTEHAKMDAYEAPRMEVIEVAVEKGYAATGEEIEGYASDSDDSEFGGANYSTRTWGNLWETGN